jgi:chemotaxis protein MotB
MAANQPIIVKKVKKVAGGHHGGAWKVAYADFVTAMMAFFLLMWLINTTSPEQKRGVADYFAPASVSATTSGSGGMLAGTALGEDGVQQKGGTPVYESSAPPTTPSTDSADEKDPVIDQAAMDAALAQREAEEFARAEMSLRQAMQDMPELSELSKHILVDQTPEGLRIQIVDQEGRSMFDAGSAQPNERARVLLQAVTKVILELPNRLMISGHTDAAANNQGAYSNWELSADRANAARRVLAAAGVPDDRIYQVTGKANSEPLFPDDPYMAANRRITIVLQRAAPPLPSDHSL